MTPFTGRDRVRATRILLVGMAAMFGLVCINPSAAAQSATLYGDYQNRWHRAASPAAPTATSAFNGHVAATFGQAPHGASVAIIHSQFGLPVFGGVKINPSADTDYDSLPDVWEVHHFGALDVYDGTDDPDDDGLTNAEEFALETNPTLKDTDGDEMEDGWEVDYTLQPLLSSDATEDPDGDTFTNWEEFRGGSNPRDNTSIPGLTILDVTTPALLVVGGSPLAVEGLSFSASCSVQVNGVACTNVSYSKTTKTLSAVAPPGTAGLADIRVVNSSAGTTDEVADAVLYTNDPFDAGLDTTPGLVRSWQNGDRAVLHGYVPVSSPLQFTTPRGAVITAPCALRQGYDAGFIIIYDAPNLNELHPNDAPSAPEGYSACTPVFDIGGLTLNGAEVLEIDEPFVQPVTITWPVTRGGTEDVVGLASIETHLDDALVPYYGLPPGMEPVMTLGEAPVAVNASANTVTFEVYDFTTYSGVAAGVYHPADVNQDEGVNALDVQLTINEALGLDTGIDCDVSGDGFVNAIDVQLVINGALGLY